MRVSLRYLSVFSFLHCGVDSFPFTWSIKAATSAQGSCPPVAWPFLRVRQAPAGRRRGFPSSCPADLDKGEQAPLPLRSVPSSRGSMDSTPQISPCEFPLLKPFSSLYSAPLPVPRNISANGCPEWGKSLKWGGGVVNPFSKAPREAAGKQSRQELRRNFHAVRTIHQWESFCPRMI